MKRVIFLLCAAAVSFVIAVNNMPAKNYSAERTFFIEERIRIKEIAEGVGSLRIWVPYPVNDEWQVISDFELRGPFDASFISGDEYGNRIICLKPNQSAFGEDVPEVVLSFKAKRKEYNRPVYSPRSNEDLSDFLKPNTLVPITSKIRSLAEKITKGKKSDLEKVKAIYDYIIKELTYCKDDPRVCGIGDTVLTLQYKKGICTDYHSLFISLARSLGIPAKFEIGLPVSRDKKEGSINGYHCWAKFYLKGEGWIPVDISEADKYPEKKDYFFGNIDENRLHLITGRDIYLEGAEDSQPLNFFVFPYTEFEGTKFVDVDVEISFNDLKGGV